MTAKLKELDQMDLSGKVDIGGAIDQARWQGALEFIDRLGTMNVSTLDEFNKVFNLDWAKLQFSYDKSTGLGRLLSDIDSIPGMAKRIRDLLAYNDWFKGAFPTDEVETWQQALGRTVSTIQTNQTVLAGLNATLEQCKQDLADLTELRQFTIDSHNATAAVQDQTDAIDALQHVVDQYTLSQMKNNLEIMKIQYNADSRHGLTRDQKDRIAQLEHENQGIQIKEEENQIEMQEIRVDGLYNAQEALDQIRRQHDDAMYNEEIRDLDKNIKDKNALYSTTLTSIMDTNAAIATAQATFRNTELTKTIDWARNMHTWLDYAHGSETEGSTAMENPLAETFSRAWSQHITQTHGGVPSATDLLRMAKGLPPIPGLDVGGTILETGIAQVHKGEYIVPPGRTGPSGGDVNVNVDIDVKASLGQGENVEEWGKRLGSGISAKIIETLNGSLMKDVSTRKGGTVNVPGVSVTTRSKRAKNWDGTDATSTIIQAPATTRSRFRVG